MLNVLLKRAGRVTGPRRKHTSHSSLEFIKRELLGLPQFRGGEYFLYFGSALHEAFLEGKYGTAFKKLNPADRKLIVILVKKLNASPVVASLMKNSIREHRFEVKLNGVKTVVILDAKQLKLLRGFDLKTTTCKNQRDFEAKMGEFGYVRQGLTYMLAAKLKYFYFVGINKEHPYDIYIVDLTSKKFASDLAYAKQELKFLLYFYKYYGKAIERKYKDEGDPVLPKVVPGQTTFRKSAAQKDRPTGKNISKGRTTFVRRANR